MNKKDELAALVAAHDPHIIGITETWTHAGIFEAEINLPGYVCYRKDKKHGKGGGVVLYVKSDIISTETTVNGDEHFEL